jgi:hypothetical protein
VANTAALSGAMKQAALGAVVDGKTLKAALYLSSATTNGGTGTYTATGEVSGTGYTAGGVSVTNANSAGLTGEATYWTPSASISYSGVTLSTAFDSCMLYSTTDSNRSLGVFTFGSQTITAGTFTIGMPSNDVSNALIRTAGAIALGDHGGDWDIQGSGTSPQTVTINTQAAGSSLIVVTLSDLSIYGTPTDNKSNTFTLLESSGYHGGLFTGFGLEVYGKANAAGGSSHAVSIAKSTATEESTLIVVEAKGATIQDTSIVTRAGAGDGVAYTSASVTTTGPALLISAWCGDGFVGITDMSAAPENGWTLIDSLFLTATSYIQAAVAVKAVTSAGTYTCDWTPANSQGAILFLAAVQA